MSQTFFEPIVIKDTKCNLRLDINILDAKRYHAKFLLNLNLNPDNTEQNNEERTSTGGLNLQNGFSSVSNFMNSMHECYGALVTDPNISTTIKIAISYDKIVQSINHTSTIALSRQNWDALMINAKTIIDSFVQFAHDSVETPQSEVVL